MNKELIKKNLIEKHSSFIDFVFSLSESDFSKCKNGKWTAGQQLEHIGFPKDFTQNNLGTR